MNKYNYNKLTPFKWFILENFPLIDEDFDALTNWQLFCKLGKEINKIINSQNNVGQQMENVTNAFIALQDYVDNYFDNLDVQDEINNKLDDMVESGELENIIASYLETKAVFGFDNLNEMKTAENLTDGTYAETYGFYGKNDGGNALYKIRTITNSDVVDNVTIVALNDVTLVAELIIQPLMNSKVFGLVGDGVTNDTDALQLALNTTNIICQPNESYYIDETITINHSLNGNGNTFIIPEYSDIDFHSVLGLYLINQKNLVVENCKFIGSYTDDSQKIPYNTSTNILPPILSAIDGADGSIIRQCQIEKTNGHSFEVYGNTVKNITVENCTAIDCGVGVGIEQIVYSVSGSYETPKNITINNFYSDNNMSCQITSGSGISVNNCYFKSRGYGRGIVTTNEAQHDTHVVFNGCKFEHNGENTSEANSRCILIDSYGNVKNVYVTFNSCSLKGDYTNVKTISLSQKCRATFTSCEIEGQILQSQNSYVTIINSTHSGSVRNSNILIGEETTCKTEVINSTITASGSSFGYWTKGYIYFSNTTFDSGSEVSITFKAGSKGLLVNSTLSKILNLENLYESQMINTTLTNDTRFFTNVGSIIGAVNTAADLANIPSTTSNLAMVQLVTTKKIVYKYGTSWYYMDGTIVS